MTTARDRTTTLGGLGFAASFLGAAFVPSVLAAGPIDAAHATGPAGATDPIVAPAVAARTWRGGRVDLETPTFSNPTRITNRLFPISRVTQVVQLGHEGDEQLRHEITLLDRTKTIRWNGQRIDTLVSQFVAYADGRVAEIALDYFAQADDGAVWYFGEDVDNYVDGVLDNHDGTWLAGRDGPPGMIMPAHPRVGDVYRPENIPGLVFEEVTVKRVDQTVPGPRGAVRGAILVQERLQDGTLEDKVFAPGYGEFEARVLVEDELVTVAVASPTDTLGRAEPRSLESLSEATEDLLGGAAWHRWAQLEDTVERMAASWERRGDVPPLLEAQMTEAIDTVEAALQDRSRPDVRQGAVDASLAVLDLESQYEAVAEVDEDRLAAWRRQLQLDRDADDAAGIASDRVIIAAIDTRLDDDRRR